MPVRDWSLDSEIHVPVPASFLLPNNLTMAALVKPHGFSTDNHIFIAGVDSAGQFRWQFGVDVAGKLYFKLRVGGGFPNTYDTISVSLALDEWQIVGFSGPGITDFRKFHIRSEAGVWTHPASSGSGISDPVDPVTDGFLVFGKELNSAMAVAAVWDFTTPDADFEGLGEHNASLDWATTTPHRPLVAFNFDQTTATEQIPDLIGEAETIVGTLTDPDTDPIGITGTTIVDSSDLTWDFFVPPPPLDFFLRFSGGASNADPLLSHGGAMSSVLAENLIPNFPRTQAVPGVTYYTCVYLYNADDSSQADVDAYFSSIAVSTGVHVAMGVAPQASGATVPATANSNTAPAGVTFSTPTTEGAAISLGTIDPLEGKGIWVRVTLDPGSPGAIHNTVQLTFNITPL